MDSISIRDLEIFAYHGVNAHEKQNGQNFYVSVNMFVDMQVAGSTDNLDDTVDYAKICEQIKTVFTKQKYNLIETCACQVAQFLLLKYPKIQEVEVEIKKPDAPINMPLKYVSVKIKRRLKTAYIGLGSNMGDKEKNIRFALELMEEYARIEKVSDLIVTKPIGNVKQEDFLNGAAQITTMLTPHRLLEKLQQTEKDLNRVRTQKWGPRTIDLDILFYENCIINDNQLTVPHTELCNRMFVLQPLSQIAPDFVCPSCNKTVAELKNQLKI